MTRIIKLIADIKRNGYGIGKPEPLKGNLSGYWSRKIDDANRVVYRIEDGIPPCRPGAKNTLWRKCAGATIGTMPMTLFSPP